MDVTSGERLVDIVAESQSTVALLLIALGSGDACCRATRSVRRPDGSHL